MIDCEFVISNVPRKVGMLEWGGRHASPRDENFLREGGGRLRFLSSVRLSVCPGGNELKRGAPGIFFQESTLLCRPRLHHGGWEIKLATLSWSRE